MKAPRFKKNESESSFRARVATWERITGKKYPKTGLGTREERALSNRIKLGSRLSQANTKDYTQDQDFLESIKEYNTKNLKKLSKEDEDEQQIADIASGKTDLSKVNTTPLNRQEIQIGRAAEKLGKMDEKRLDKNRKAENQEIRDEVALDNEVNPWGIDSIRRAMGSEVGRTSDVVSDQEKGLLIQNPPPTPNKNKGTILTIDKKNPAATGTSLEKKFEKIYGKRKMKRFNQVYGKLNLSDRMRRHLLMSKAFRDM